MKEVNELQQKDLYDIGDDYMDEDELIQWCSEEEIPPSEIKGGILICHPAYGDIELENYLRNKFDIMDEEFNFSKNVLAKIEELESLLRMEVIGYEAYAIPSKELLEYLDKRYEEELKQNL